jgi:RNA polymerase sigma factor (sigma-70 family)
MSGGPNQPLLPHLRKLVARPGDETSDRELLRRFGAHRDEAAFAELVRRHGAMVQRVCRRVLHGGPDADDVCQAAFLLLAQRAMSARWHESLAGWLFQTAYRLSLKARTAAQRRIRHEALARTAPQPDPLADVSARELQAIFDDELSRLPEKYRAPILLCCLEGRSRDEAARCLGWSLSTVKDRLERGRERLRLRLARRGLLLGTALTSAWLYEGAAQADSAAGARAAVALISGQATLADLLPVRVAALAKGVMTTMFLRKTATLGIIGLALVLAGTGVVMALSNRSESADPVAAEPPRSAVADAVSSQPQSQPLSGHKGAVRAVAFSADGKLIATAGADKTARIWDAASGRQIHKLDQPDEGAGVAFSPDGKALAATSSGKSGWLVVWDAIAGKSLWQTADQQRGCGAVAFSPDGKILAAGLGRGSVMTFDFPSGRELTRTAGLGTGAPTAAAFSPDGKLLAVGDGGGGIHLLDPVGRLVSSSRGSRTITALAFLADGSRLAAADGLKAVLTLDTATGKPATAFTGTDTIRTLAVTADGKRLATAEAGGTIRLWDVAAGKEERRFKAPGAVNALAFSPDGNRIVTAGDDGAIVWDLTRDEKPLPRDFKLTDKDLDALWADLANDDGGKVYGAVRLLRADPARSVPFLRERLKPKEAGPDEKKLKQLIADLDADEFDKREAATKELQQLGRAAEGALRAALAGTPSAEVSSRAGRLLKLVGGEGQTLTADQQREVRAVRVLEQAGTPEATKVLEVLARDAPAWWVAQEAKEALRRLAPAEKKQ